MDVKKKIAGKQAKTWRQSLFKKTHASALLDICKIDTASSFEEGKRLLENNDYDIAVLDIMGVRGFDLLSVANKTQGMDMG